MNIDILYNIAIGQSTVLYGQSDIGALFFLRNQNIQLTVHDLNGGLVQSQGH